MSLTFSAKNQVSFLCPIFDVKTQMATCTKLRDLVWRGEGPEVRKGCQACMRSGKCPAAVIISKLSFGHSKDSDEYGSLTPKQMSLREDVLSRILPVIVQEHHLAVHDVPEAERKLILTANERIEKQLRSVSKTPSRSTNTSSTPKRSNHTQRPVASSHIAEAARTGDLAAAIN